MAGQRLIAASQQRSWEDDLRRAVSAAYADQRRKVQSRLESHGLALTAATTVPVWNDDDWSQSVSDDVEPVAQRIADDAEKAGKLALAALATWGIASKAKDFAAQVVTGLLQAGGSLGQRLNDKASVLSALQAAADRDQAAGEAQRIARAQLKAEAKMRSARSAINDALDGGEAIFDNLSDSFTNSLVQGVSQGLSGFASDSYPGATVTWNSVLDDRTRDAHADADGQTVGLDEPFEVGGEELQYPGDPAGSDENTINCRCWLTYEGIEDSGDDAAQEE